MPGPRTIGFAVAAMAAAVVLAVASWTGLSSDDSSADAATTSCDPSVAGTASGGATAAGLSKVQTANATTIIAAGQAKNVPAQGLVIALAVAGQESTYRILANPAVPESLDYPHDGQGDDHDSVGLFQQRPSQGWGTPAQLMNATYSADAFYTALLKVHGWQSMPVTVAAQTVQQSQYPDAYAKWASLAGTLVSKLAGVSDPSGCDTLAGQPDSVGRAKIVDAARAELGVPYVWDAGDANGPTKGLAGCDQAAIGGCAAVGFDCSGLALYAWAQDGIRLDHSAANQYGQGRQVAVAQVQPGDLLFWATNTAVTESIHHVAIYLGGDKMIEAPESGQRVHVTVVRRDGELMPLAVEPAAK